MAPLPHRIRRLRWHVGATSPAEAFALRKELRGRMDPMLLPAVERAFGDVPPGDEIVRIPRLEVRLRISGVDDVTSRLPELIQEALREQVNLAVAAEVSSRQADAGRAAGSGDGRADIAAGLSVSAARGGDLTGMSGRSPTFGRSGDPGAGLGRGAESGAAEAEEQRGHPAADGPAGSGPEARRVRVLLLLEYLETGSLPWPLANLDTATVLSQLRIAADGDPAAILDLLPPDRGSLSAEATLWFRLLQLVSDAGWGVVARAVALRSPGAQGAALTDIVVVLSGSDAAASMSRHARLLLAAAAVARARIGGDVARPGEIASIVVRALGDGSARGGAAGGGEEGSREDGAGVREALDLTVRLPDPARAAFREWLLEHGPRGGAAPAAERRATGESSGGAESPAAERSSAGERAGAGRGPAPQRIPERSFLSAGQSRAREGDMPAPAREDFPRPKPTTGRDEARAEPLGRAVSHAGLVLLHPFLPRFFESTGIREPGAAELPAAKLPRAAALLHLLATGQDEPYELELDFIKILLGLGLQAEGEPGARESDLPISEGLSTAGDREEVDALLAAVIGHWRALKNTSVQGLRTSFLQRRGLVREEEQGFRLHVEPAPFDMLLGQLPWGVGTVKLPWMKRAIFTDWPAS